MVAGAATSKTAICAHHSELSAALDASDGACFFLNESREHGASARRLGLGLGLRLGLRLGLGLGLGRRLRLQLRPMPCNLGVGGCPV